MTDQDIDRLARALWESDCEHDPLLHRSWEFSKDFYRRHALVAAIELTGATP